MPFSIQNAQVLFAKCPQVEDKKKVSKYEIPQLLVYTEFSLVQGHVSFECYVINPTVQAKLMYLDVGTFALYEVEMRS